MSEATDEIADRDEYLAAYARRPPMVFRNVHGQVFLPAGQMPTSVLATATGSQILIMDRGVEIRIDVIESTAEAWAIFVAALVPPEPPSEVKPFRSRTTTK
jgi:hypothetical protein